MSEQKKKKKEKDRDDGFKKIGGVKYDTLMDRQVRVVFNFLLIE